MKKSGSQTRPTTRPKYLQRVEVQINKEVDTAITAQTESLDTPSPVPIVKVEENDANLKMQTPRHENEKDILSQHSVSSNYCGVCNRRFYNKNKSNRHLKTAYHKRMVSQKQISPGALSDEPQQINGRLYCKVCKISIGTIYDYRKHLKTARHKKNLLPASKTLPDEFDPNGYCCVCNRTYKLVRSYKQHLRSFHKMELTPRWPTPDPNITPDPNNVSNHCDSCKWTFNLKSTYKTHLEKVHKMVVHRLRRNTLNPNILPDVDDPNFYCKSCQVKYKSNILYRIHIKRMHGMKLKPLRKETIFDPTISGQDINDKNKSCAICKFQYSSKRAYRKHMETIHKDGKSTPVNRARSTDDPNIQPDPNDSNFYCASCQRHYKNSHCYRIHIRQFHPNIKLENFGRSIITPIMAEIDAGDHNNTGCTICERNYSSRQNYKRHMKTTHKDGKRDPVVKKLSKLRMNPSIIPVWDDPNHYCQSCTKKYSCKTSYRSHIKKNHSDVLQTSMQLSISST